MLTTETLLDDWSRTEDFADLFTDTTVALKLCSEVGCWSVWDKDVADTFEGAATVAVKLGRSVKDSVGKDVGCEVAVTTWLSDKEFVAKVESELLKELAAVDETLDCCAELMEGFIDVSLVICVIASDEDVDTSTSTTVDISTAVTVE